LERAKTITTTAASCTIRSHIARQKRQDGDCSGECGCPECEEHLLPQSWSHEHGAGDHSQPAKLDEVSLSVPRDFPPETVALVYVPRKRIHLVLKALRLMSGCGCGGGIIIRRRCCVGNHKMWSRRFVTLR